MTNERITGLDLARSLSILGMILVNYKIAMAAESSGPPWLSFLAGLLEGRASAIFVVLAGIGFTIMTRKARLGDSVTMSKQRFLVWKRSLYLLALGFLLLLAGWSADILHYYALFLFLASFLIRASGKTLIGLAALLVVLSQCLLLTFRYQTGWDSTFHFYTDFWTAEGFLRNLLFNGFHPALPWFSFFLVGMWVGRLSFTDENIRKRLLLTSLMVSIGVEILSLILLNMGSNYLGKELAYYLFQTKPMPPNLFYMVSATSIAITVILLSVSIARRIEKQPIITSLITTGQMALTHYVLHVLVGLGMLQVLGILENGSLTFAVLYGVTYYVLAIFLSSGWQLKYGRGPLEAIMRKL